MIPENEEYDLMLGANSDHEYYDESIMFSAPRNQTSRHGTSRRDVFLDDKRQDMTWGRRIALNLMNYKWYNPLAGKSDQEYSRRLLQQTGATGASVSNIKSDDEYDPENHQFGTITLIIKELLARGMQPHPERKPEKIAASERDVWATYPVVMTGKPQSS